MERGGSLARLVLAAALVAGVSYLWITASGMDGALVTVWKGSGVALLALWCAMQARSLDGWLISAVMALCAAGDVLLETHGQIAGALAFLAGHVVAIGLYLRNRRDALTLSQKLLAALIPPVAVFKAWGLTGDPMAALYALFLGVMASTAWISRFPRYRTGIGALMFVASDLLIFARMGPFAGMAWVSFAIWGLYFGGQALIAIGVVRTLQTDG
jgi:uncharacterized membrane protein YhhN